MADTEWEPLKSELERLYGALVDIDTLASAIEMRHDLNIIHELIHHCPDLTPPCTNVLLNPLAQSVRHKKFEFVDLLLTKGACVNEVVGISYDDEFSPVSTVLGLTIQAQERPIIDTMLRVCGDANPRTVGLDAPTAVGIAIMHDREDLLTTMLDSGISPQGKPQTCCDGGLSSTWALSRFGDPKSVLEIAALRNNASILQKLVRPSFFDPKLAGRALAIAILEKNDLVVPLLLDVRIDVNRRSVTISWHRLTRIQKRIAVRNYP
ncbi:hypothetical protein BJX70DRAFT_397022 [Aspergillus crustosus]